MLSQTATDVLSECDYERVRVQLHHALHGDGNPPRGERLWLAGRHISVWHDEGGNASLSRPDRHATA
ncbi:hypothetical protein [Ralstonia soli]|uniref:Uncharacterized protein n=1 Tax=Ralstonia soli TaxID=2953896 RepID=A0ABT1AIA6_9RALS|nr:hypothetical protein [Ralstonia soli]MCO5398143.1 hypothetical protein [Ralstonia soli]